MATYSLTLAARLYDRTAPVLQGELSVPGVDLRPIVKTNPADIFTGLFNGDFDAAEMSLAEVVYYTSRGQNDFLAIPIFPYRMFRHGYMFCDANADFTGPESLNSKRVAFPRVVFTAGVWMRGMLVDEYGLSPADTSWYYGSMHHWDPKPGEEISPRDGAVLRWVAERGGEAQDVTKIALLEGEVDALCTTRIPPENGGRLRRLVPDFPAAEAAYFKRTGIYPIMHAIALRTSVIEAHPELPEALFHTFVEAKELSNQRIESDASVSLVWKDHYLEHQHEVFAEDPWVYGLEKNRHVISKFLSYAYDQGVSAREMAPEELFVPSTLGLTE
ncbi:MAG: hypothetical protein IIC94_07225 [Chloroflexi bacterium]|nr:hypothetical protein [Chloroflexota bacterium]